MAVTLKKASTGAHVKGSGWNSGTGVLRFIGGAPATRRMDGPVIKLAGPVIDGEAVRCVVIEPYSGEWARAILVTADGAEYPTGRPGDVIELRDEWIRSAVAGGIFAGIARMR